MIVRARAHVRLVEAATTRIALFRATVIGTVMTTVATVAHVRLMGMAAEVAPEAMMIAGTP